MTQLPIHPFTGLRAIGFRRDGRPIYPVRGGSQPTPPTPTPPPGDPAPAPTDPPTPTPAPAPTSPPGDPAGDKPLGPAGEKALAAERARVKELERQMAALSPLTKLAEALGAGTPAANGRSEVELLQQKFSTYETQLADERAARWRAEVAAEKGLTAQQAARLQGSSRDELAADADALVALFPAAGPRTPAPDPSQGARGGQPGPDLEAQIAEARGKGDFRRAISLERQKLLNIPRPT